eukprot:TRINITY_DN3379_c0_g2_i2.p1 TRINITY_DN3379_c0_g2~~TRINITY_DN3379_c0_g2_i2.p1  ORF type:complete len:749 (+),score=120.41 TRINITY_DN3379_c0_g2_i2:315-2249(+)
MTPVSSRQGTDGDGASNESPSASRSTSLQAMQGLNGVIPKIDSHQDGDSNTGIAEAIQEIRDDIDTVSRSASQRVVDYLIEAQSEGDLDSPRSRITSKASRLADESPGSPSILRPPSCSSPFEIISLASSTQIECLADSVLADSLDRCMTPSAAFAEEKYSSRFRRQVDGYIRLLVSGHELREAKSVSRYVKRVLVKQVQLASERQEQRCAVETMSKESMEDEVKKDEDQADLSWIAGMKRSTITQVEEERQESKPTSEVKSMASKDAEQCDRTLSSEGDEDLSWITAMARSSGMARSSMIEVNPQHQESHAFKDVAAQLGERLEALGSEYQAVDDQGETERIETSSTVIARQKFAEGSVRLPPIYTAKSWWSGPSTQEDRIEEPIAKGSAVSSSSADKGLEDRSGPSVSVSSGTGGKGQAPAMNTVAAWWTTPPLENSVDESKQTGKLHSPTRPAGTPSKPRPRAPWIDSTSKTLDEGLNAIESIMVLMGSAPGNGKALSSTVGGGSKVFEEGMPMSARLARPHRHPLSRGGPRATRLGISDAEVGAARVASRYSPGTKPSHFRQRDIWCQEVVPTPSQKRLLRPTLSSRCRAKGAAITQEMLASGQDHPFQSFTSSNSQYEPQSMWLQSEASRESCPRPEWH